MDLTEFSNKVADALDQGLIPWRLPAFPKNALTGKAFGGVNPILLNLHARRFNFRSPHWATFAQWQMLNTQVRQEDVLDWGARIVLYKSPSRSTMQLRPVRDFVYNLEQTSSPVLPKEAATDPGPAFEGIVKNAGINVEYHGGTDCRWVGPPNEHLRMPHKWMFELSAGKVEAYYDSLGHEIFHWTESRMDWKAPYDVNELRAEIGTGYLGAILGAKPLSLDFTYHHRTYASTWAKILRLNPEILFSVCDNVTATVSFLLDFIGRKVHWLTEAPHGR